MTETINVTETLVEIAQKEEACLFIVSPDKKEHIKRYISSFDFANIKDEQLSSLNVFDSEMYMKDYIEEFAEEILSLANNYVKKPTRKMSKYYQLEKNIIIGIFKNQYDRKSSYSLREIYKTFVNANKVNVMAYIKCTKETKNIIKKLSYDEIFILIESIKIKLETLSKIYENSEQLIDNEYEKNLMEKSTVTILDQTNPLTVSFLLQYMNMPEEKKYENKTIHIFAEDM